jgi:nicotinamidase-related amidase
MSINKEYRQLAKYTNQLRTELSLELFPKAAQKIRLQQFANDNLDCVDKSQRYDALVLIDIQKQFCDVTQKRGNIDTENTCKRIASVIPSFRAANLPIYCIYFSYSEIDVNEVDFHHYEYAQSDILIRKTEDSAFVGYGDPFKNILTENNHKNLLVMGFNATGCLLATVSDAQDHGFKCTVITDCISNDKYCLSDIAEPLAKVEGLKFVPSSYALDALAPPQSVPRITKKPRFTPQYE